MSYQAEPFREEDHRDHLLKVWADNMSDGSIAEVLPQRFDWLYRQNPAGETQTWVVTHVESGALIGCGSMVARTLNLKGRDARAAMIGDFAVDQHHRTAGPAVKILRGLAKGSVDGGLQLLYGYPNAKSTPIFKRVRYRLVGQSREWVKPLKTAHKIAEHVPFVLAAKALGKVVDSAYRLYDWSTQVRSPRLFRGEISEQADASFDALWQRARPSLIAGEKSAAHLNWRYGGFTTADYAFYRLYRGRSRELLGFVVYAVREGQVIVADLFCDFERDTELLLFAFSEKMRQQRHEAIRFSYVGSSFFDRALQAQHFFQREEARPLFVYLDKGMPTSVSQYVLDEQNWFMLDGDLDI